MNGREDNSQDPGADNNCTAAPNVPTSQDSQGMFLVAFMYMLGLVV